MTDILQLPIHIQIALAGGYLGYVTAYSGLRSSHTSQDAVLLTLVFGTLPALAWPFLTDRVGDRDLAQIMAGLLALALAVLVGAIWRWRGWSLWYRMLIRLGVHVDDGLSTAWESLIHHPGMHVTQIMVRTTDGTELFCRDVLKHATAQGTFSALDKFSPLLGNDGSVVMLVDEEETAKGKKTERECQFSDEWGVRLTYISPNMIDRVEMRVRDTT